ncbi:Bis(5'nucleosyl)-tetraphosphatase, ApaH [Mariprofundus ferrinatatus]|uniref:bis(5'-nucleosyl)-tetraphosphatase (symmetrical) n=1 Tax=Mariprofundus ferrinatatus TaxID=1921087 RepID=A0A2K8L841_9PROT|nr:symmetrical bis(5'-nucleosyl)-tetraphosphatase [Mariprofundus ferrinatatus]ATX82031.1 Bis(5'nucleosyl)-tetraphosphatase, ApaH [Mariprofundus ferrinatatus]
MTVYAVGDIQGCYDQLKELLNKVRFNPEKDTLWCAGDLVNRGPKSLKTLRFLKSLGDAAVCVLGNHDLHLLELAAGGQSYRRDTLRKILKADDRDELIEWLRHLPLLHHDKKLGWCMVHAGLHPDWSLKKAKKRARKVEKRLQGAQWKGFCKQMHHRMFPLREPKRGGDERALFSAAVFTRTRYCTRDGKFNWDVRSGKSRNRREKPWFEHSRLAWHRNCHVVYGHWAAMGLVVDKPYVLGLDTGCVWGGSLTLAKLKPRGQWVIAAQTM